MSCPCDSCGTELCPGDVRCGDCGEACDPDKTRGFVIRRPMQRGDTVILDFALVDPFTRIPPNPLDAGFQAWFTVKDYLQQRDIQARFQGTYAGGEIVSLGGGWIRVTMPASSTLWIPDGVVRLYYDVQAASGGRVWTHEKGLFEVSPDVTRSIP